MKYLLLRSLGIFLLLSAVCAAQEPPVKVDIRNKAETRVYIKTVPPGASVKIDGEAQGVSDCLVKVPDSVKKLNIEVTLDENSDAREIIVQGGRVNRVEFVLGEVEPSYSLATKAHAPDPVAVAPSRQRPATPVGKLLDKLEQQNAAVDPYFDPWARTLRDIVELGPEAVPELIAELDATNDERMLRCLGFMLRAIDDKRAVPALIRAIPKMLRPIRSSMGLYAEDEALGVFMQKHDIVPGESEAGNRYSFGRPVQEILGALTKLTGESFEKEQLYYTESGGTPRQQQLKQELFYKHARRWADWWEENWEDYVDDESYAEVELPRPRYTPAPATTWDPEQYLEPGLGCSNLLLGPYTDPNTHRTFYDLDTGLSGALPERWRNADDIQSHREEIEAWAASEGYDLMGVEVPASDEAQGYYALCPIRLQAWELSDKYWKATLSKVAFADLQAEGVAAGDLLLHCDPENGALEPEKPATFLFRTSEGTPGLLFVGVVVRDDSLQPGGVSHGDCELRPVGFYKGRRLGWKSFVMMSPQSVPQEASTGARVENLQADPTTTAGLKALVEGTFPRPYGNGKPPREAIEWGEPTHKNGEHSIRYKFEATTWSKKKIVQNMVFTFSDKGDFLRVEDAWKIGESEWDADGLKSLVEDFFRNNWRDITDRKTVEWGEPAHEKGQHSIRYKFEATIHGNDKVIQNKLFTFSDKGDFLRVEDAGEQGQGAPAVAETALKQLIKRLEANERLYANIDAALTEQYVNQDTTTSERKVLYTAKDGMFRVECAGASRQGGAPTVTVRAAGAFDGETKRHFNGGDLDAELTPLHFINPHRLLIRHLAVATPLSTLLSRKDPLSVMHWLRGLGWDANTPCSISHQGVDEFHGLRCEKVLISVGKPDAPEEQYELWLVENRNSIPVRVTTWRFQDSQRVLVGEGSVNAWRELSPGVWFPISATYAHYDWREPASSGKKEVVWRRDYIVDSVSLSPKHDLEFFQSVEPLLESPGNVASRPGRLTDAPPFLEFRVLADADEHAGLIDLARRERDDVEKFAYWAAVDDDGLLADAKSETPVFAWRTVDGRHEMLVLRDEFNITDRDIVKAIPSQGGLGQSGFNIEIELTKEAGYRMGCLTGENLPDPETGATRRLAIIVDGKIISAPTINDRIYSRAVISGNFDEETAKDLAERLNNATNEDTVESLTDELRAISDEITQLEQAAKSATGDPDSIEQFERLKAERTSARETLLKKIVDEVNRMLENGQLGHEEAIALSEQIQAAMPNRPITEKLVLAREMMLRQQREQATRREGEEESQPDAQAESFQQKLRALDAQIETLEQQTQGTVEELRNSNTLEEIDRLIGERKRLIELEIGKTAQHFSKLLASNQYIEARKRIQAIQDIRSKSRDGETVVLILQSQLRNHLYSQLREESPSRLKILLDILYAMPDELPPMRFTMDVTEKYKQSGGLYAGTGWSEPDVSKEHLAVEGNCYRRHIPETSRPEQRSYTQLCNGERLSSYIAEGWLTIGGNDRVHPHLFQRLLGLDRPDAIETWDITESTDKAGAAIFSLEITDTEGVDWRFDIDVVRGRILKTVKRYTRKEYACEEALTYLRYDGRIPVEVEWLHSSRSPRGNGSETEVTIKASNVEEDVQFPEGHFTLKGLAPRRGALVQSEIEGRFGKYIVGQWDGEKIVTMEPIDATPLNSAQEWFSSALEQYQIDTGSYPDVLEHLRHAAQAGATLKDPYISKDTSLDDLWGNRYRYETTDGGYVLYSNGPDGKPETEDDILISSRGEDAEGTDEEDVEPETIHIDNADGQLKQALDILYAMPDDLPPMRLTMATKGMSTYESGDTGDGTGWATATESGDGRSETVYSVSVEGMRYRVERLPMPGANAVPREMRRVQVYDGRREITYSPERVVIIDDEKPAMEELYFLPLHIARPVRDEIKERQLTNPVNEYGVDVSCLELIDQDGGRWRFFIDLERERIRKIMKSYTRDGWDTDEVIRYTYDGGMPVLAEYSKRAESANGGKSEVDSTIAVKDVERDIEFSENYFDITGLNVPKRTPVYETVDHPDYNIKRIGQWDGEEVVDPEPIEDLMIRWAKEDFPPALETCMMDTGTYPATLRELVQTSNDRVPGWKGPYLRANCPFNDGWKNPYRYETTGGAYTLYSNGPDSKPNTEDDILIASGGEAGRQPGGEPAESKSNR